MPIKKFKSEEEVPVSEAPKFTVEEANKRNALEGTVPDPANVDIKELEKEAAKLK